MSNRRTTIKLDPQLVERLEDADLADNLNETIERLLEIYELSRLDLLNDRLIKQYRTGHFMPVESARLSVLASTLALLQQQGVIR